MLDGARIAVVVPAFDVAPRIVGVLGTLPAFVDDVIVVDDGSADRTAAVARDARSPAGRVTVVSHASNRGVGAAIATGYIAALARDADVIAVMAGDGQMDPDDLGRVVGRVVSGGCDYAKGNRLAHRDVLRAMPLSRLIGNVVLSALTRVATGLWHIGDSQCGYTAVHRRVLVALDPSAMWTRYGYPNHLLGALALRGFRVSDVTVRPVYAGERSGVRVRDAVVTIPRILLAIAAARASVRGHRLQAPRGFVEIR
ncbi:MAG: glycosyltransferase family 2 protein [Deltaproteobacteria bacterium]